MATDDYPILPFSDTQAWDDWLADHHATASGVWIRFYKKNSQTVSITYAQALDSALCYGWIDSQTKSYDDHSYLQKFTPRRNKSIWSKVNTQHVARLTKAGKMKPAGLQAVADAKKDGRWDQAYHSPSEMTLPDDFLKELAQNEVAQAFFETLNKTNRYAIAWRLQTAKRPETRRKRMQEIVTMLSQKKAFH